MNNYPKTKTCTQCRRSLPLSGFYKKNRSWCKRCVKEKQSEYRKTERARLNRARRRSDPVTRNKKRARDAVKNAWEAGRLTHPKETPCAVCGAIKRNNFYHHHKGYAKENWLDVICLCFDCHKDMDKGGPKTLPPKIQMHLPLAEGTDG